MAVKLLPSHFQFSQSSLQVYQRCRRRFFLRYLRRLDWPAPMSSDAAGWEQEIQRGQRFHEWVQQQAIGLDVSTEVAACEDTLLQTWWENFNTAPPKGLPQGQVFSEVAVSVPMPPYRLVAKFDRVIIAADGRAVIVDWKTGRSRPQQAVFADHWQTLVYRYVLAVGGDVFTGGHSIKPEAISLLYWHAGYPDALAPIGYSAAEHLKAQQQIGATVAQIGALEAADFNKTEDLQECRRCEYSSYCGRGRESIPDREPEEEDLAFGLVSEDDF